MSTTSLPDSELAPDPEPAETPANKPADAPGTTVVFAVGNYLVGDADDELLSGHPDIRY